METPITLVTAGILGVFFFGLSLLTIYTRAKTNTSLGAGESDLMSRRIRMHGNFSEYVPILLIILFLLESAGVHYWFLVSYSVVIIFGRIMHAYGLSQKNTVNKFRIIGMQGTLWALVLGSLYLLYLAFLQLL